MVEAVIWLLDTWVGNECYHGNCIISTAFIIHVVAVNGPRFRGGRSGIPGGDRPAGPKRSEEVTRRPRSGAGWACTGPDLSCATQVASCRGEECLVAGCDSGLGHRWGCGLPERRGAPRLIPGDGGLTTSASVRRPSEATLARTGLEAYEMEARGSTLQPGCTAAPPRMET
ncbi:hypothetical protein NDU88_007265 [Pleurodeles waltl]|uniref:Uncharacterized protein n=1 Tax=Pleurodeles waltl TaxID=8319 RepID=A0AAV7NVR2_PLEWA|nr:hypothetical protein NDU88_007265 [Pleurodeles waltl]